MNATAFLRPVQIWFFHWERVVPSLYRVVATGLAPLARDCSTIRCQVGCGFAMSSYSRIECDNSEFLDVGTVTSLDQSLDRTAVTGQRLEGLTTVSGAQITLCSVRGGTRTVTPPTTPEGFFLAA